MSLTDAVETDTTSRDNAISTSTAALPSDHDPVFLYYDPHPVHRKMAQTIGAEFVQCERGGAVDRVRAARGHDFGDRTVILEGGVPLLEGGVAKALGNAGQLIALGADGTFHDLVDPLPFRTRASRLAHRFGVRQVDGTLAVSDPIATIARQFGSPARVIHPFIERERYDRLGAISPDLTSRKILCVGRLEPKNGQRRLIDALEFVDSDVTVHFVGPGTDDLPPGDGYETHGFVDEQTLIDHYATSALFVMPAPVGAFSVATMEALRAGIPTVITPGVGTVSCVIRVSARLETLPTPRQLADAIDWYFDDAPDRAALSRRASNIGSQFDEATGLDNFVTQYGSLLRQLDVEEGQ